MEQDNSIAPPEQFSSQVTFLVEEEYIQVHIFGQHNWHQELRMRLLEMGVELHEQFCSPCG